MQRSRLCGTEKLTNIYTLITLELPKALLRLGARARTRCSGTKVKLEVVQTR